VEKIKSKLELIRRASTDAKAKIDEALEKDVRIDIATINCQAFADDLYRLMGDMAKVANPVLKEMGLEREAVSKDIEEFVEILDDNNREMYFASINLDAKYGKNKYTLENLSNWFGRLNNAIDKILAFLETETETSELQRLFGILDKTSLSKEDKKALKDEFVKVLNRLNKS